MRPLNKRRLVLLGLQSACLLGVGQEVEFAPAEPHVVLAGTAGILQDADARLSIRWEQGDLVLQYSVSPGAGTISIRQADQPGELGQGAPLYSGPIPASGVGSLILSNWHSATGTYFCLNWDAQAENPNPERWQWVPPGQFRLGSPENEIGHESDEEPQMHVTISRGFYMSTYEVTQGEYSSLMSTNPSVHSGEVNLPVENVSWQDAVIYCGRLTTNLVAAGKLPQGYRCRLPTEAEWEYAARAGMSTRFSYGEDLDNSELASYAWYQDNSAGVTHPVGLRQPNPWGLYDIHGNVAEWCSGWYAPYLGGFAVDSVSPSSGDVHIIRGGSYVDEPEFCRSAFRMTDETEGCYENVGLRVVLATDEAMNIVYPMELVRLPSGAFVMGSPEEEVGRETDESPRNRVTLSQPFSIGRYEVMQAQYSELMQTNPTYFSGYPNRPVEQVSWEEANEFCARLTARDRAQGTIPAGYSYRLPTEAEWEYAARAGTTSRFSHGDDPGYKDLGRYAWFFVDGAPHGVGAKLPNPWGISDMHGNVYEWCLDWYGQYAGGPVTDPQGPASGYYRVLRGGDSRDEGQFCRSAFRLFAEPSAQMANVGFRVVLAAFPAQAIDPLNSLEMVWIEPGSFMMGSFAAEQDRESDEGPPTKTTISRGFWLGKYEVTQAQFTWLMQTNPSYYATLAQRPVEQVTWDEALEFCVRLTAHHRAAGSLPAGYEFRLPTEAEWEYACRAGSTNRFCFGDDHEYVDLPVYARFFTGPTDGVGAHRPNRWGLCDMHGNVAEWCMDWYADYPGKSTTDPRGPQTGMWRVYRGGGIEDAPKYCRSAARGGGWPMDRSRSVGFRVALVPVAPQTAFIEIPLVAIPAGTFLMGSPVTEPGRAADEGPQIQRTFPEAYWVGRHEVTQAEFQFVMGTNPSSSLGYDEQPVEQVTWFEALEFCNRLTDIERGAGRLPEGYVYRLPTEAEWEYAARAGSVSRYYYGDDLEGTNLGNYDWFLLTSSFSPHVVELLIPNSWGLFDMHGNVSEWCMDLYAEYADQRPTGVSTARSSDERVIRGGSFNQPGNLCRSAARLRAPDSAKFGNVGFRVVLARPHL